MTKLLAVPARHASLVRTGASETWQPPRSRDRRRLAWITGAAALVIAALAGLILYVQTDTGLLTIQTDDEDVKVSVERGGKVVTILDLKTAREITLRTGEYRLKLEENGHELKLVDDRFTLKRGDKAVATIRRVPQPKAPGTEKIAGAGAPRAALRGHDGWIYSLAFSPDGRWLASGGKDKTIRLWDVRKGTLKQIFPASANPVFCVRFSPDGNKLASCSLGDGQVHFWETESGRALGASQSLKTGIWDLAFAADGQTLAAGCHDGSVCLLDLAHQQPVRVLHHGKDHVRRVLFFPKANSVVSAGSAICLWDLTKKNPRLTVPHLQTSALTLSANSKVLAAGHWAKGQISLFDTSDGKSLHTWRGHKTYINDLAYSPNGGILASSSHDGTVRLWDPKTGSERAVFVGHKGPVDPVAFSPDGKTLASGGLEDGQVLLWDTSRFADAAGPP